jgi:hypothetical protein
MYSADKHSPARLDAKCPETALEFPRAFVIISNAAHTSGLFNVLGQHASHLNGQRLRFTAAGARKDNTMPLSVVSVPLSRIAAKVLRGLQIESGARHDPPRTE